VLVWHLYTILVTDFAAAHGCFIIFIIVVRSQVSILNNNVYSNIYS